MNPKWMIYLIGLLFVIIPAIMTFFIVSLISGTTIGGFAGVGMALMILNMLFGGSDYDGTK